MLSLNKLIKLVPKNLIEKVTLLPEEEFDFNLKDYCFLIREGEILSYAENKFTQLLKKNDPVGLAEAILGRQNELSYRRVGAVKLFKIDSKAIRTEINGSGPLVKSIIKYSLKRIFFSQNETVKTPLMFEEGFLYPNEKDLRVRKFEEGTWIFRSGFSNNRMYFLEKGKVQLLTKNNRELALLTMGACFGESTLIRGKKHNNSALALENCVIRIIDDYIIEKEIEKESYLVQLVLFLVLRRLEFMNSLRMTDNFSRD